MHNIHNKPNHRIKELIDSMPKHTPTVKKDLCKALGCSLDKVNRWYRDATATIIEEDQFALVAFFNLVSISDLYRSVESKKAKTKPIAALS
jgi:hypothetical protein